MVWEEKYLIDIYDKVPLLGAMALFIPLCGDVDHISDAMRCGPFVAKYMKKIKIRRLLFFQIPQMHIGAVHSAQRMRLKYFRNTKISVTH